MKSENSASDLRAVQQAQHALALQQLPALLNQLALEVALLEGVAARTTSRDAAALTEAAAALLRKILDQLFDLASAGETTFPWWQDWQRRRC